MYQSYNDYHPRPTSVVYQLRKEGDIGQAYKIAINLFRQNPNDDDVKKAYAWTLIDLCKRAQNAGNIQDAQGWLSVLSELDFDASYYDDFAETIVKQIKSLRLKLNPYFNQIQQASELSKNGNNNQAYEIMSRLAKEGHLGIDSHENYGWIIYKYLRDNIDSLNSVQARTLLRDYINLKNERPSNLHSQILNFALNYSKKDSAFKLLSFLKYWGPDNLRGDDFSESYGQDGKKIPSLMTRIAREVVNYPTDTLNEFIKLLPRRQNEFIEMLRECHFWNIYHTISENRLEDSWKLFNSYLSSYSQCGASKWHSKILSLAERNMNEDNQYRFFDFFKKWDPKKLLPSDWLEEKGENGESYRPLASKALKKANDALNTMSEDSAGDLTWLIDAYDVAMEKYPDDDWMVRAKALLLIKAGKIEDAELIYKDLSLKMGDKYYIWQEFSNCVSEQNAKIGMLCKAICSENNEDFIGKIRLDLAEQLISIGKKSEAAHEVKLNKDNYISKGWAIKPRVNELLALCGQGGEISKDNQKLYDEYCPYAEEYAYSEIPYTNLVLIDDWKNDEGKRFQKFVNGAEKEIVVNIRKFPQLKKAKIGQVWGLKLYQENTIKEIKSTISYLPVKHENVTIDIPLLVKRTELADWSILPEAYGYVNHVNEEKKAYHIYTQDSKQVFEHYENKELSKGDYIRFRQYKRTVKDEIKICACCISKCDESEALPNFKTRIVAVDDVNEKKQLFHFVLGPQLISGILHYNQTPIRPAVGDFLRIYYFVREKKEVKRPGDEKKVVEVLKVEITTEVNDNIVQNISGLLELKYKDGYDWYNDDDDNNNSGGVSADFAFIGDYYVHRNILVKYNITKDCHVNGRAVYTGDDKWKVFELEVI